MKEEDKGPISIFPSWNWLYLAVVVYTAILIVFLYLLTVLLDHSVL
ncbi:hypothetical protein MYX82_05360 [Acidobacteria bacterium AH-259-D05]|nr:hypothetical protein [Acidobacteria bacterium AH-259-D05]